MTGVSSNDKTIGFEPMNRGLTPCIPSIMDEIYYQEYDDSCDEFNVSSSATVARID